VSPTAGIIDLSIFQVVLALVLVLAIIVVSVHQSLGLERDLAIGTIRAVVQLYAVGLILAAVFARTGGYESANAFSDGFAASMAVAAGIAVAGAATCLAVPRLRPSSPTPAAPQPVREPAAADD